MYFEPLKFLNPHFIDILKFFLQVVIIMKDVIEMFYIDLTDIADDQEWANGKICSEQKRLRRFKAKKVIRMISNQNFSTIAPRVGFWRLQHHCRRLCQRRFDFFR